MKQKLPYRYRVAVFLFFLTFICQLDRVAISLVGVRIKSAFQLSTEQFGWVISAFALAYTLFEIPSGMLGDRIGQRSLFIRTVLCWSLFTALIGVTTGLASLIIVRFLFGAGEAGCWPNGTATLSRWMPAKEISKGQSSMGMGTSLGSAFAPLIIVPIAVAFGWRVPFFVITLFGLVWVLVCYFAVVGVAPRFVAQAHQQLNDLITRMSEKIPIVDSDFLPLSVLRQGLLRRLTNNQMI